MLLTTLRKVAEFVRQALSLLLGVVFVVWAGVVLVGPIVLVAVSAARSAGVLGMVALVALVAAAIAGITATTMTARKEKRQAEAERQRAADASAVAIAAIRAEAKKAKAERQAKEEILAEQLEADRKQAAWAEAKRREDEAAQLEAERKREERLWQGTGGLKTGSNWIRRTWPNEARDFTPWLVRNLYLVSTCTGLDLRFEGAEVYIPLRGRADIVARDNTSKSKVIIENQLDVADFAHSQQLSAYGDGLNARIRIWIAADFSPNICRDVRDQNLLNESRPGGAIYYLLKLRPNPRSPISLAVGPTKIQHT